MVEYFEKWFGVMSSTGDTGNFFLAIWSLGALALPFVVVTGALVMVYAWIQVRLM